MFAIPIFRVLGVFVISMLVRQEIRADNPPHLTSTRNCYYTFVVPQAQDQGAGESSMAEVIQLRQEVTDLKSTVANLEEQLTLLSKLVRGGGNNDLPCDNDPASNVGHCRGVHFKYWGSTQCPVNTSIIYEGFTAKSLHSSHGSGSEYLCLPMEPQWTGNEVAGHQSNSYIYGVEYWANGLPDIIPDSDRHTGVPCAICETQSQQQLLMVPAATTCPIGWTTQYHGYLMAERHNHASSSNYICVKRQYEKISGSTGDQTSGYAIPVEVVCGALPCPPYEEGKELSCVVCTK